MNIASKRLLAGYLHSSSEQLRQRRTNGDCLDVPREVSHDSIFPTKESALEAGKDLMAEGFCTEVSAFTGQYLLQAHKTSALDPDIVEEFTTMVFNAVNRHGGDYDGWGADLIEKPPRSIRAGFLLGYKRLFANGRDPNCGGRSVFLRAPNQDS